MISSAKDALLDHSAGEDSPNTVSESALDQNRSHWAGSSVQRETKSEQSFAEWKRSHPLIFRSNLLARPKGGASRRILLTQIERLQEENVVLQTRLRALVVPIQPLSIGLRTDEEPRRRAITGPQTIATYSMNNTSVDFPSTFAGAYTDASDESGQEFMEQIVDLAGRLRMALAPYNKDSPPSASDGVAQLLQDRPDLKELLMQSKPHPERREQYAQVFAKRK